MKIITFLITSLFIVSSRYFDFNQDFSLHQLFQNWKQKHNKYYSAYEELYRFQAFYNNYQAIQLHNSNPDQSYTMSLNAFSDLSNLEFQNLYLNNQYDSIRNTDFNSMEKIENEHENQQLLTGIDWRGITEVKDQGSCGAGWAFSVVAAVEAYQNIQSGKSILLSEQELIDCQLLNDGCQGGTNVLGLKYVKENGLTTNDAYPYVAMKNTQCKISSGNYKISSYVYVGTNEAELKKALTSHPVSAGVDATNWQSYDKGVFDNCTTTINHYILVVGYEDSGNWIIKNSWGTSWGDSGHIKLSSGNTCGILDAAYQNS